MSLAHASLLKRIHLGFSLFVHASTISDLPVNNCKSKNPVLTLCAARKLPKAEEKQLKSTR